MRNKNEIERAIITLLCEAYDKGLASVGYSSYDDTKRNAWVNKQLENIEKWYNRDVCEVNKKEPITKDWLLNHNFEQLEVLGDWYSYQGGGDRFSFIVEKIKGKWYADIGKGFTSNSSCALEYTYEIEDIFFLLSGKRVGVKKYIKPHALASSTKHFELPGSKPCNPPRPAGR